MKQMQTYYDEFRREMGWDRVNPHSYESSKIFMLYIHMLLTTEVAEVAEEIRKMIYRTEDLIRSGMEPDEAYLQAKQEILADIGKEFADCIAYLCKLGNFFELDLEQEFYSKMEEIKRTRKK